MKINWNYIKGLFLVSLVVFLVAFSNKRNEHKKVHETAIKFGKGSNLFMDYQMVNKLLIQNGERVQNKEKSVIDLHKLEATIQAHPMVEKATVFITIDGVLNAIVKQRTPIARVVTESKNYYIDSQAKKMPLSSKYSSRVVLVSGAISEKDNEDIFKLASKIENNDFLNKEIIGIQKIEKNEYNLNTRIGNQIVKLGNLDSLDLKFKKLEVFYLKAMSDSTINNYTTINLKYSNQIVCEKK